MTKNSIALNRTLFLEDNLPVMRGLDSESIDLIATDPPFNKGVGAFEGTTKAGVDVEFKDVWHWGDVHTEWTASIFQDHPRLFNVIQTANAAAGDDMGAFLCWMGVRVLEMHRVLKPTGSIYLHCDSTASHYLKAMMDAIFGRENFRNEVVWRRNNAGKGSQHEAKSFGTNTDTILYYAKSAEASVRPYRDLTEEEIASKFNKVDEHGRRYNTATPLFRSRSMGTRPNLCYEWKGFRNPHPSGWRLSKERLEEEYEKGNVVIRPDGKLERRNYLDDYLGVPIDNLWIDIPRIGSVSKERTGYPTQKPLALYKRMIEASSNPGDMVLDPFAGCATTCVAAEQLGRQWIGIDIQERAGDVIRERLQSEVSASMAWNDIVRTPTEAPERTDGGDPVAPELVIVGRKRNARRLPLRDVREQLIISDGQRCQGCGWEPPYPDYLQVDHKKPRSLGGEDDMDNYTLLCDPCNRMKSNKLTLTELRWARVKEGRMNMNWWDKEKWK